MNTEYITLYSSTAHHITSGEFEEALYNSTLQYSLQYSFQHVPMSEDSMSEDSISENIVHEKVMEALQKSIRICALAGIHSQQHFKRRYIFDERTETLHIDWLMSKKGLNVLMMHIPVVNEAMARWLWELAEE
jgi:hypothetical protein